MTGNDKIEFNALSLIAYKKAGINYPAMQQGQPYAQVALPQSLILTAANELLPERDVVIQEKGIANKPLPKRLKRNMKLQVKLPIQKKHYF